MPDRTESLWRLLPGVRTQERPRFLFFAGLATLISLAQTLGLAGTEALFLARYGAALLPITFIAAALFTVLGSMVYAARVGTERNDGLFVRMLLLAAAALAGSAAALQYGFDPVLPILFCLFYLTQALFVNHLWTFSGDFFDTVASKRLVPLFTIGGSVGGVIGGLAVVGATEFVGPVSLIFAWSALLAASAVLVVAMRGQLLRWGALDADEADETSVEGIQAAMRYLGTSALGRWLSVSAMAMMLSLFVLQYIYSDVFARTFPDSSDLAAFFGIYLAATNVIEILVEVRVTPWLISRVGVPITNLLHPVLTIASFGGLAIGTGMPAAAAARINRELLDNSLSGPVRALLYNAMPRRYRGRTRAFLEGIIVYAGMALAGMVLLALDAPDRHWLSVAGGAMAVLYLGANLRVRHEYFRTLVTELRAGRLDLEDLGEEVGQGAVESLSHVWEQLLREEGNNPSSTVLQFIPSLAERGLVRPLIRAASHPNADVRRSCINALRGSDVEEAAAMLLVALEDDDAKVRLAALRALTRDRASSRPIEPLIKRLLDDPDSPVRAEAAVHAGEAGERVLAEMIRSQDRSIAFAALKIAPASALEHVATRLTDDDPAIRAAALESHARAGVPPAEPDELLAIAEDPDPAIRRAGVMLLANVDDPSARAMLAGALADSSAPVRFAAETVLGSLGEAGIEAVEPLLRAHRERAVLSALRVIARSRTPGSRAVLKGELRHRARALWQGTVAFGNLPSADGTAQAFLRAACQDDIIRSRRLAFRILELLEDPKVVRRIDKTLRSGPAHSHGDVLEVLSHMGDREAARLLVLIHETSPLEDRLAEISEFLELPGSTDEIVRLGQRAESRWIQMASRAIAAPDESHRDEEEFMKRLLALKQIPLFSNLSLEQLEAIRKITREVEYLPNETIVSEGDPGGEIFLLIEGEVRFVKGYGTPSERRLSTQPAVSYFGEMAALDDMGRTVTVIATQPSVMLCLDGSSLKDLIRQMPEISFHIMRVLTARVRKAEEAMRQTTVGGDAPRKPGAG